MSDIMPNDDYVRYRVNDHRIRDAAETRRVLEPLLPRFGVTRVGNITGLDQLGVSVSSVTRPRSRTIVVFSGKGPTKDQSYVSGAMEAIETYCAERQHFKGRCVAGSFDHLRAELNVVDPKRLILPIDTEYNPALSLEWVAARDVITGEAVYVPEDAVFIPTLGRPPLVNGTTNGLCAGNSFLEALLHGIYEVVERDSCSMAEVFGDVCAVCPHSVPSDDFARILSNAATAGCTVRLYHSKTDIGIPTFFCVIDDVSQEDLCFFNVGHGTHLDPVIAAERAIQEAAQARLLYIAGAREDLWEPQRPREIKRTYGELLQDRGFGFLATFDGSPRAFGDLFAEYRFVSGGTLTESFTMCRERLAQAGLRQIFVIDLTPRWFPLHVLRVLIPGAESYYSDQTRIGPRIRGALYERAFVARN